MQKAGMPIALLPFQPFRFFRHYFPKLSASAQLLPFIVDPQEAKEAILIVPESTPPALIRRLRRQGRTIMWWMLAPSGLLTNFNPDIRVGDLLVAFSSFTLPEQKHYLFVHPQPHPKIAATSKQHQPHRLGNHSVAIYTGKGRLKPLPPKLHRFLVAYHTHPADHP